MDFNCFVLKLLWDSPALMQSHFPTLPAMSGLQQHLPTEGSMRSIKAPAQVMNLW
jgi:hypothetical protein